MDIASIISSALGIFGQILGSKDSKIKSDLELQAKTLAAQQALAELQTQIESKKIDLDIAVIQAQGDINKLDAQSEDKYRTRWRPTIGWICAIGLGYNFLLKPLIASGLALSIALGADHAIVLESLKALPELDTGSLMGLIIPLLGIGGFRTVEKIKGTE